MTSLRLCSALATLAMLVAWSSSAAAQIDQGADEVAVDAFELEAPEERENVYEDSQGGPTNAEDTGLEAPNTNVAELERMQASAGTLEDMVRTTPVGSEDRPEYMFRLAELYYDLARLYETRAFGRRDEGFTIREDNPQRADMLAEMAEADLDQADYYASEAVEYYREIWNDYGDDYPEIDAVLFYLGANMLQLDRTDEARIIFEELARSYPDSEFLSQALLLLGEIDFGENYFETALEYYLAVAEFPGSSTYPYALYKSAWCQYNLAESTEDFEYAVQLLDEAALAAEETGRTRLRRDALRDMTLFYSEVYPADVAFSFFEEIAPDMLFDLVARLARIYGDKGQYSDSNTLYRDLISLNSSSYKIIEYQREIVRNTRPTANEVEIVREVRRLVELMALAESGQFADADSDALRRSMTDLERLLRQLATTYHREAQTTLNEQLFGLAYNLYRDYLSLFPDGDHSYEMWFYYGELLRRNDEWLESATAYDNALALTTGEGRFDEQALYNACSSYLNMVDVSMAENVTTGGASDTEDVAPVPEPQPITEEYQRMLTACDRYTETGPRPEDRVQIEFVTAFMYYSFDHLEESVSRFGTLAMNYYDVDVERARVSAELMLESLALLRRYERMKEWIDSFKANAVLMADPAFAQRLEGWSEQIDFKLCRDMQTDGLYVEAGHCFIDFAQNHFTSELLDKAFYNAALAFESGDELDAAISAHRFLIEYTPDSELVPETVYELGRTFQRMAMYDTAAGYFEEYVEYDRGAENAKDALIYASQFRQGLGQHDRAIDAMRLFIRTIDEDEEDGPAAIAEAYFQIAETRAAMGDERTAIDEYEEFIGDFDDVLPGRALQAHTRIADLYMEREYPDRAYEWYEAAVDYWNSFEPEARAELDGPSRDAAAKAQFMLGERVFTRFESVELEGSEAEVQEALAEKISIGQDANAVYSEVINMGRPGWSIAAFTRVGQLYHVFYEQVIDAPVPAGLTTIQTAAYQETLEAQANEVKQTAMDRYADAILVAREAGYFSEFAEEAASLYGELDPTFKAGSDIAIVPGFDEASFYAAEFVLEADDEELEDPMGSETGDGADDNGAPATTDDDSASADPNTL